MFPIPVEVFVLLSQFIFHLKSRDGYLLWLMSTVQRPAVICIRSHCETSPGKHTKACAHWYLRVRLLNSASDIFPSNCCRGNTAGCKRSNTHSFNFNVILATSIQYPACCFLLFSLMSTGRPPFLPVVNIDVVMETVIVIQMHAFFFCPAMCQGDLYSFHSKCQGNKTDTYRKCQQHCLTGYMESDSNDKQYFSFLFSCQMEPCGGGASFSFKEKKTVIGFKWKQMALLFTESLWLSGYRSN